MKTCILLALCCCLATVYCSPSGREKRHAWDWGWWSEWYESLTNNNKPPNFVIMLMDDVGYGDVGIYGNPVKDTPNIDRMAKEGMMFTDFYAPSPLCSPSRASLLTGRLPIRAGFFTDNGPGQTALALPNVTGGLDTAQLTISEALREKGYKSKIVGKWHVGHEDEFNPLYHGFDEFFGSPNNHWTPTPNEPNIAVYKDHNLAGRYYQDPYNILPTGESNMSQIFLDESLDFIDKHAGKKGDPFMLIWAPDATHTDNYASSQFLGTSDRGIYGDAMREMDYGVGRILEKLHEHKIEEDTLVLFTSDNGGASYARIFGGNNAGFMCGKFTTFEGGMRVPMIAWWPGHIAPDQVSNTVGSAMDFFPTMLELAEIDMPADHTIDGASLVNLLLNVNAEEEDRPMFYYRGDELFAVRIGLWKAHRWVFSNPNPVPGYGVYDFCLGDAIAYMPTREKIDYTAQPLLFHLGRDPEERTPTPAASAGYQAMMPVIQAIIDEHLQTMQRGDPVFNYWDQQVLAWSPPGCEEINECLPVPPSNKERANWTF